MKKLLILMISFLVVLTGCNSEDYSHYEFQQSIDQISKIEIALKETYDPSLNEEPLILKTLDPSEHQEMINMLLKTKGGISLPPPVRGVGVYIIRITYANGGIEMLGNYNNAYITPEGEIWQGAYDFDSDAFYKLISHYLGEEITPPTG